MLILRSLLILALCFCTVPALATEPVTSPPASLEERLRLLEERFGPVVPLNERLTISGLIEVEGAAGKVKNSDGSSDSVSDLALATAQLGFEGRVNEQVGGNIILLFEEGGETEIEIDEAAIRLEQGRGSLQVGRLYLPFGAYNSHFISDPLTLELGETRQTALVLGYEQELFTLSAFVFNGSEDKIGRDDHVNDGGVSLTLTPAEGITVGAGYLSDLAESGAGLLGGTGYSRQVAGWNAFVHLEHGPFAVEAEYLAAVRAFAAADLNADFAGNSARPQTLNLEVAYSAAENVELALRYAMSKEFAGQPEK